VSENVESHLSRARNLIHAGDVAGAKALLEKYVQTAQSDGVAQSLYAFSLMQTGDLTAAIATFQAAIRLGCDDAPTHLQLAMALKFRGRCIDALRHFDRACKLDPDDARAKWAATIATLRMVYSNSSEVASALKEFDLRLEQMVRWFDARSEPISDGVVAEPNPFHIAYVEDDLVPQLSRYGALCARLMASWDSKRTKPPAPALVDSRVRIGIVSRYFYRHSVWSAIIKGMIRTIDRNRFRLALFHVGARIDDQTKFARSIADSYLSGLEETGPAVDAIRRVAPDILIYPEIGMDPLSTRLAALRLAPVQMASWGHPVTTGLPTLDYFLSAKAFEPSNAHLHYTEQLVALPDLGAQVEREPADPSQVDLATIGLDPTRVLFVCPGVPWKYTPEFDDALCAIACAVPSAQFLFFQPPVQLAAATQLHARITQRFRTAGIEPAGRFVFGPWLSRPDFLGVVSRAAACLDGFGFSGFNTALQCLQAGTPMVTLPGRFMRGRLASGILTHVGLREFIAKDVREFAAIAAMCASRPDAVGGQRA
jgi:protein O-GlcNAc transferase